MLKRVLAFIFGEVKFEIEGGLTERFLNMCAYANIMLKDIKALPTGLIASVSYRGFKEINKAAVTNKCKLTTIHKTGLCYLLAPYKYRYGILLGISIFAVFLLISQYIVWDIRFFECSTQQQAQLRHSLYEKGIYEGALVSKQMIERIKKELIIENTQYGWVTLNYLKGRIVLEKTNATPKPDFFSKETTNVVAAQDGIVRKIDASGGFVMVVEGQSVAKGDILISGVFNDTSGNFQKVHAQGKIYADLEKTYVYTQSLSYSKELPLGKNKNYYELYFLNKSFKLFNQINSPPKSEQKLFRYPLVLFGFHFPATVYEYEVRELAETQINITPEQALHMAREKTNNAIMVDLPQAKILAREETVAQYENKIKYTVKISVNADIGQILAVEP